MANGFFPCAYGHQFLAFNTDACTPNSDTYRSLDRHKHAIRWSRHAIPRTLTGIKQWVNRSRDGKIAIMA